MSEQKRQSPGSVAFTLALGLAIGTLSTWSHGSAREVAAAGLQQGEAAPLPPRALASNSNVLSSSYEPVDGKGGEEISGPYQVVKGWPQPVIDGWTINAGAR